MIGFDLLRPELVGLLVFAPLVLGLGLFAVARRKRDLARLVAVRQVERFLPELSFSRARTRVVLAAGAALLFAFAAVGPVRGYTEREVARRGLDLVLCIDTSRSMLAQDVRPSRLERAKREIRGLFDALRGDRVALLAFSGDVREVAPLTSDTRTLASLLDYVTTDDNVVGGTDLAAALQRALALFDGRTGAHEAIVLLTDGEDLAGRGKDVAAEAAKRGIRVYVVGIGTVEGGKIPIAGRDGRESFLRDGDGKEVVTKLESTSLEELARATGGEFLSTQDSATPLEELMRLRISRLEGRDLTATSRRVPHDRFQWPLVLALVCMLGELALHERRGGWRKR